MLDHVRSLELVAHRGYTLRYPENTIAAFEAAIAAGARYLETDVQLSSDGVPVLFHDRTLARLCGVSGAVHERTFAGLRAHSCADRGRFGDRFLDEHLASLEEFVQLVSAHPQVHAFVEIKRAALEQFGHERVLERVMAAIEPVLAQCSLISFSLEFLATVRRRNAIALGAVFDAWRERRQSIVEEIAPEFVFCDVDGLPRTGPIDAGRARLAVYEVADPKLALDLAARGVELIETFAIAEMLASLRTLGASPR